MTRTRIVALIVLAAALLTVGTVSAQARVAQAVRATCLTQHEGALAFCNAVSDRKTVRVLRYEIVREARRAHVAVPIPMPRHKPMTWNPVALQRANDWHRHLLAVMEEKPTWHPPLPNLPAWICIHEHEGAWDATGGTYWGGLQMDVGFMTTYGRDMIAKYGGWANLWSPRDQIVVAIRAYDSGRGFGPWPNTRIMCGV